MAAAAILLMEAGMTGARAEDYTARTVTIILPFAAGGPASSRSHGVMVWWFDRWSAVERCIVCFGPGACLRNSHFSLKVLRKLHWVFLTYISGPMKEGRPCTPLLSRYPGGSRTYVEARDRLAGQTHPNNAQGLD